MRKGGVGGKEENEGEGGWVRSEERRGRREGEKEGEGGWVRSEG